MRKNRVDLALSGIGQTMKNPFTYTIKLGGRLGLGQSPHLSGNRFPESQDAYSSCGINPQEHLDPEINRAIGLRNQSRSMPSFVKMAPLLANN
jgi:hypothetical protein